MTTAKPTSKGKQVERTGGPTASRPHIPGYGIPKGKTGLLPWRHVTR